MTTPRPHPALCLHARGPRKSCDRAARLRLRAVRQMIAIGSVLLVFCSWAFSLSNSQGERSSPGDGTGSEAIENDGVPVEVDGRPILVIYARIGGFSPPERARAIEERLIALGQKSDIAVELIHAQDHGTWTEIVAGSDRIMGITEADANAAERKRPELAAEYTEIIRQVVKQYRLDHTWQHVLEGVIYTALATVGLAAAIVILFLIRRRLHPKTQRWLEGLEVEDGVHSLGPRMWRYLGPAVVSVSRAFLWLFLLTLLQAYGTLVLSFFPATKYTSYQITNWLFSELALFGKVLIGYIPNLILIMVICLVTSYLIKVNKYFFGEIRDQRVTIHGFYPDWAEPTAKLVKFLIVAAAAIVIFPYLPGSDSPAFKGISVFLGVLLSLGSTSAVAHGVAGTILTYMRAFQVGDFVRIGNDVGEVVEKTLLVTRICTQKKEVVTVPNGTVLGGVVINYSAEGKHRGVIFHTVVTIGYKAPWRQVHELLISAARATEDILRDPAPFVLQTALSDFYVAYELNAYTAKPGKMQETYSVLHQNIQDGFNEAGLEINSPHYLCLRDGNQTTIPRNYLAHDYEPTTFNFREINGNQPTGQQG